MTKTFLDYFDIKPRVKGRPRMSRRGHVFTPATTVLYENRVAGMYRGSPNATFFETENLGVTIVLEKDGFELTIETLDNWESASNRGDCDNYAKSILDALNGVAWTDDAQVRTLLVIKS